MEGKTCIVTGASSGIGKATAEQLAGMGARVVMICRNRERAEKVRAEIRGKNSGNSVEVMLADFTSLDSVREVARQFEQSYGGLDVLVNNAGLVRLMRSVTIDGFETTFQVNYLSHFLLTNLLLGLLKGSAPSRIVNVSSIAHHDGRISLDNLQLEEGYGVMKAYSQSKLALVLFTYELSTRLAGTGVAANCLHPGAVATDIWGEALGPASFLGKVTKLFMVGPQKGAETSVFLASSPDVEGVTGRYFQNKKEKQSSSASYDPKLAKSLWEVSTEMVGLG
jgi:NAD(P)-dependent dehydrogenase (short-subunit alcohol dehydrogenase family)